MWTRRSRDGAGNDEGDTYRQTHPGHGRPQPARPCGRREPVPEAPCLEHRDEREAECGQPEEEVRHHGERVHHAIAELDERMKALLRIGLVATAGPVLAAEARARQADERTRGDDEEERETRRESDPEERPRRDGASPSDCDRH